MVIIFYKWPIRYCSSWFVFLHRISFMSTIFNTYLCEIMPTSSSAPDRITTPFQSKILKLPRVLDMFGNFVTTGVTSSVLLFPSFNNSWWCRKVGMVAHTPHHFARTGVHSNLLKHPAALLQFSCFGLSYYYTIFPASDPITIFVKSLIQKEIPSPSLTLSVLFYNSNIQIIKSVCLYMK